MAHVAAERVHGRVLVPENPAIDSEIAATWARTLEQITTNIGRLAYLDSLRSHDTGRYGHEGLTRISSEEQVDRILRASHEMTFAQWLNRSIQQQYDDLRMYLAGLGVGARERSALLDPKMTDRLIPANAREPERLLYRTDLETVIELLRQDGLI